MINTTLVHVRKGHKTLMIEKKDGKFMGVGGKFMEGETPEECLIREVKEETNLDVTDYQLVGKIFFPKFDGVTDYFSYVYEVTGFHGEMEESDEGKLYWIDNDKLTSLNIWEGDKYFIDWMYNKRVFFDAVFYYENFEYVGHEVEFGGRYD